MPLERYSGAVLPKPATSCQHRQRHLLQSVSVTWRSVLVARRLSEPPHRRRNPPPRSRKSRADRHSDETQQNCSPPGREGRPARKRHARQRANPPPPPSLPGRGDAECRSNVGLRILGRAITTASPTSSLCKFPNETFGQEPCQHLEILPISEADVSLHRIVAPPFPFEGRLALLPDWRRTLFQA